MTGKKRSFQSKETTITCHVCKKVMQQQNFSTHMRNIHNSNETRDVSQRSIAAMFTSEKRPRIDQATSADMEVEDEQLNLVNSLSCPDEAAVTLMLAEIEDQPSLNIFTDDNVCNKESSETNSADVTSITANDVFKSIAEDQPQSTETNILESEVVNLRTDLSRLKSAVEYMRAEIAELKKSKLPNEIIESRGTNVQLREYDGDSVLK